MAANGSLRGASSIRTSRRGVLAGGIAAGAGLAGLALVGCGDDDDASVGDDAGVASPQPDNGEPRQGGNLVFTDDRDPSTFDPMFGVTQTWHILTSTNSTLLGWRHGADVHQFDYSIDADEGLAEVWEQPDDTTYILTLREGVPFHDKAPLNGRDLTASDVEYTYNRWIESGRSFVSAAILESVTALDDRHVEFRTKAPYGPFLGWLALPSNVILAPEAGDNGDHAAEESVIGTGPFMFDSYQAGVRTRVVRNPNYYKSPRPYLDSYEYRPMPDLSARQAAVRTGDVDIGWFWWQGLPQSLNEQLLRDNSNLTSMDWTPGSPFYVAGKADRPPFNDPRVRQAVSLGIDRERWIELLSEGNGEVTAAMPFQIVEPWYLPLSELGDEHFVRYDPAAARQLLEAAGYGDGITVDNYLTFSFTGQAMPEAEFIQSQMQEIGINLSIQQHDFATFAAHRVAGNLDFTWTTHTYGYDIDPIVYTHWHSTGSDPSVGNTLGINDPEMDRLLDQQRHSLDTEERVQICHDIQRLNAKECYTIYEIIQHQQMPFPTYVRNFGPHCHFNLGGQSEVMWIDA